MDTEKLDEHLAMLKYFWNEKGDIERYCDFEEIIPLLQIHHPELLKVWYDYKANIKLLDIVINNL